MIERILNYFGYFKNVETKPKEKKLICHYWHMHCRAFAWDRCFSGCCKYHCDDNCKCSQFTKFEISIKPKVK